MMKYYKPSPGFDGMFTVVFLIAAFIIYTLYTIIKFKGCLTNPKIKQPFAQIRAVVWWEYSYIITSFALFK